MKRFLLFLALIPAAKYANSQTYLYENFNSYDGTANTVPNGWYFSTHGVYTSNSSSGPSTANSYKFGSNGAYIISPMVTSGDSVSFYMKLNGSGNQANDTLSTITVYGSLTDTAASNFSVLATYSKIPTSGPLRRYAIPRGNNVYIKVKFTKVGGNLAFDDFAVYSGIFVGNNPLQKTSPIHFEIFPNPVTNGFLNVKLDGKIDNAEISIYNIIGEQLVNRTLDASGRFLMDVSDLPKGVYLFNFRSNGINEVRKIRIE
jgi:hypothetical protein